MGIWVYCVWADGHLVLLCLGILFIEYGHLVLLSLGLGKLASGHIECGHLGILCLGRLIAQAKGNVTAPNIAQNLNRMAGGSVDIKAAAKAMDLHAMENAGNYQQEFTDIDDNWVVLG